MKQLVKNIPGDFAFIWQFALDDFKTKYAGSVLGALWAFLQPMVTIVLYWFVFQLGFKSQPVDNFPFILWLMAGLVPWFFLSEAVVNATTSLADYSYLVKKILFHINILPLAKIISVLFVQLALIVFAFVCFVIGGRMPGLTCLQIPVYLAYMLILAAGISYITATLYVFFKDVLQIVSIVTQIIFWLTPIVWTVESMPAAVTRVLVFNPVYYVITGFRNALVYRQWGGQGPGMTVYYWCFALMLLWTGLKLFNKCKDHFADVL